MLLAGLLDAFALFVQPRGDGLRSVLGHLRPRAGLVDQIGLGDRIGQKGGLVGALGGDDDVEDQDLVGPLHRQAPAQRIERLRRPVAFGRYRTEQARQQALPVEFRILCEIGRRYRPHQHACRLDHADLALNLRDAAIG